MNEKKIFYLTEEGFNRIKKEHETLEKIRASKVKGEAPKIWESEDLNPEYVSFQEDMDFLETRLSELENIINNVQIVRIPPKSEQNTIHLGAEVVLEIDKKNIDKLRIVLLLGDIQGRI